MRKVFLGILIIIFSYLLFNSFNDNNFNLSRSTGQVLDSLHGVYVYYNGGVNQVHSRNIAPDNYNLGLKYQCVEFVKRYYYEHYKHKMPDSYGNAKDFYDPLIGDGVNNNRRGLLQYTNPSFSKPKVGDILVFSSSVFNPYGHVAIVSNVRGKELEIIQQNPGPFGSTRKIYYLENDRHKWKIAEDRILG
ncbi:CHAP domain-containing protein [Flavobacteriaceae bacterium M23B6Z8]